MYFLSGILIISLGYAIYKRKNLERILEIKGGEPIHYDPFELAIINGLIKN